MKSATRSASAAPIITGDVMYPYYHRGLPLSANDIGAAQQLYTPASQKAPVTATTTTTTTSTGVITSSPTTPR